MIANFVKTEPIRDVHEFLKKLFLTPDDKTVKFYDGKHEIIDDPELFFNAAKKYLPDILCPEKKFKNVKNFDHEIKTFLKILTTKDKYDKLIRKEFTYLYYNAKNSEIVGTDAYIIWQYHSYHTLGDENVFISADKFGNIILTPESEMDGIKYPDYRAVFPDENQSRSISFYITESDINTIFYLCKLAKIVGFERIPIKIGKAVFNGYLLARFIEAFKTSLPNYHILLNIIDYNRPAYITESGGRYKGLIMPMIETENIYLYQLKK